MLRTSELPPYMTELHAKELWLLIDAAGLSSGREDIHDHRFDAVECLFSGELATELVDVAPYLALVDTTDQNGMSAACYLAESGCAILCVAKDDECLATSEVCRHFKKFNVVYNESAEPLYFRYYDGQCLPAVLSSLSPTQVKDFFGPFGSFVATDREGRACRIEQNSGELSITDL